MELAFFSTFKAAQFQNHLNGSVVNERRQRWWQISLQNSQPTIQSIYFMWSTHNGLLAILFSPHIVFVWMWMSPVSVSCSLVWALHLCCVALLYLSREKERSLSSLVSTNVERHVVIKLCLFREWQGPLIASIWKKILFKTSPWNGIAANMTIHISNNKITHIKMTIVLLCKIAIQR